jgi:hypothetical protein
MNDMTDDQIREWCYRVWPTRWKELAPSSDSRALFLKETIKLKPDEDELKRIELAIVAQAKHWRMKSKVEKVYGIPRLSQWIKDRRFDDEFIDESAASIQERMDCKICSVENCSQDVHGEKYDKCTDHLQQFHGDRLGKAKLANLRKQILEDLNILESGLTQSQLAKKCRAHLRQSVKPGSSLSKTISEKLSSKRVD